MKRPFHTGGAIGISFFVSLELKTEPIPKGLFIMLKIISMQAESSMTWKT